MPSLSSLIMSLFAVPDWDETKNSISYDFQKVKVTHSSSPESYIASLRPLEKDEAAEEAQTDQG